MKHIDALAGIPTTGTHNTQTIVAATGNTSLLLAVFNATP